VNFGSMAKNVFGKKIKYSFLLCKFEKEASKKENFEKNKKNIGSHITNQRHISFLSLDDENC